jgi:hypothetical protein
MLGLVDRSQVDHGGQSQLKQAGVIVDGHPVQAVSPEQTPPPDAVAIAGPVPAQVTEVDAPVEEQGADGIVALDAGGDATGCGHGLGAYRLED